MEKRDGNRENATEKKHENLYNRYSWMIAGTWALLTVMAVAALSILLRIIGVTV